MLFVLIAAVLIITIFMFANKLALKKDWKHASAGRFRIVNLLALLPEWRIHRRPVKLNPARVVEEKMPAKLILGLIVFGGFVLLLTACREPGPTLPSKPQVDLPRNLFNADEDSGIDRDAELTVSLLSGEWYLGIEQFSREERRAFIDKVKERLKGPKEQLVYLQAGTNDKFGDVIVLLDAIRRAERNNVGLLVLGASQSSSTVGRLAVTLPPEPDAEAEIVKPDRLLLQINIDGEGRIRLNNEEMGIISTPEKLSTTLDSVLQNRSGEGVGRKSVEIKATRETSYFHVAKAVDLAKGAGATPIAIVLDDIAEK